MKFTGKVEGFEQFGRMLNELPKTVENSILQQATRETLKDVVLKPLKNAAPRHQADRSPASKQYGTLLSNIRVTNLKSKRRGERGAVVHTGNAFWGFILEKGSRYIQAKPWFLPTFNSRQSEMIQTLGEKIGTGIEREANKYRGGR